MRRVWYGDIAVLLLLAGLACANGNNCTQEGATRTRGTGRNIVHERCEKKAGDTGLHWYAT